METTPVSGSSGNSETKLTSKQQELGKADFLKLLVAQLRYQDPMKPMEDKEFIAQMAQFNSLEEMRSLNKSFAAMSDFSQLTQASSLLGKNVAIQTDDEHFVGKVDEVRRVEGEIKVMVKGKAYDLDAIQQVADTQAIAQPADTESQEG